MTDYDEVPRGSEAPIRRRTRDVFISYARDDAPIAHSLGEAIERFGLSAWHGMEFEAGEPQQSIEQVIRSSGAVIVLLSAASLTSQWLQNEIITALDALPNDCVFPVVIGEVDVRNLPAWLAHRRLLHLRDNQYVNKLVDQLLPSLETALGGRDGEPGTTRIMGELPPRVPLVGVSAYLDELRARRTGVTWIVGMAGAGKTCLAREFAFQIRNEMDFIWWLPAMGARAHDLNQRLLLIDENMKQAGYNIGLIVVDALDEAADDITEPVSQLTRLGERNRVVVTTRGISDSLYIRNSEHAVIRVGPLSESAVAEYLESFTSELQPQQRAALWRLAQWTSSSPLLLRLIAHALRDNSADVVPSVASAPESMMNQMLEAMLHRLSETEHSRLDVLSFCSEFLTLIRSSPRWVIPGDEALFSRLLEWGFLTENGAKTLFTHKLIVNFLRRNASRQALEETITYVAPRLPSPEDVRSPDLLSSVMELTELADPEWDSGASANLTELLIWQASVWRAASESQRAELLCPRILMLAENSRQTPLRVRAMNLQSALAFDQGRIAEASAIERRAANLAATELGPGHPIAIASLANLAISLRAQGNLPEAIALLRQVVERSRTSFSDGDPDLAAAFANLAICLREAGLFDEAMRTLREAIDQTPPGRLRLQLDQILGALLTDLGRLDEASTVLEDSLARADHLDEPASDEVLMARTNLAMVYARRGQPHKAISIQSKVVDQLEVTHGSDHPTTLSARTNYAILLSQAGSLSAALEILSDATESRVRVLGTDHLDTLQSLILTARLTRDLGEDTRALEIYTNLLADVVRVLGPGHALSLTVREEHAQQLSRTGDWAGAQIAHRELLADLETMMSPDHPMIRRVQKSVGVSRVSAPSTETSSAHTSLDSSPVPKLNFDNLSPRQYEDMISVLLSREIQARRIDGTGGDSGRHCYFSDESGTHVYELKSFTGRMTPSRRRQVRRSLDRAMVQAPHTWTLVVPIDPTASEQRWFDSLQAGVSTRLDWKGKTWLEEKLAKYPEIYRYFSGAAEEVVHLLGEVAREEALPHSMRGLSESFSGAVRRLNEVDPYYQFVYSISDDTATVTAHPRYPDAPRDRPLRISATLRFDDSPASRRVQDAFADFMTYGTRVIVSGANIEGLVVDAPGGLGGEFPSGELILDGSFGPAPETADAIVLRVPPTPPIRHTVPLYIEERSRGPAGGLRITSRDRSGLLVLELRVDSARHSYRANLTYRYRDDVLPSDAVPVLRLCASLAKGERMAFADPSGQVFGTAIGEFNSADWPEAYIRCAEKLAEIQQLVGVAFPLPLAFTPEDQRDMEYARMLLSGQDVQATWSGMMTRSPTETVRNLLEQIDKHGQPFAFATVLEETLEVAGGELPLGWVQRFVPSAQLSNLDEVKAWHAAGADGTTEIRLEPVGSNDMTVRHMPGGPPSPSQPTVSEDESSS